MRSTQCLTACFASSTAWSTFFTSSLEAEGHLGVIAERRSYTTQHIWSSLRKRRISCSQFSSKDLGTTTQLGRSLLLSSSLRPHVSQQASAVTIWQVLPRPISSPRIPPEAMPVRQFWSSHTTPSIWYLRNHGETQAPRSQRKKRRERQLVVVVLYASDDNTTATMSQRHVLGFLRVLIWSAPILDVDEGEENRVQVERRGVELERVVVLGAG